jgi:hypothetical protein
MSDDEAVRDLARSAGITVDWTNAVGEPQIVTPEVLRRILGALGFPSGTSRQVTESRERVRNQTAAGRGRAHARRGPVEDRAQVDVERLQRAQRALDLCKRLVGADRRGIVENRFGQVGAHHVDAVEGGLGRGGVGVAMEREARLADGELELLGHLAPVDDGADLEGNPGLAAQRLAGAPCGGRNGGEIAFGCGRSRARSGLRQTTSRSPG